MRTYTNCSSVVNFTQAVIGVLEGARSVEEGVHIMATQGVILQEGEALGLSEAGAEAEMVGMLM